MAIGVVGRCHDGVRRVGGLRHAKRMKQLVAEHAVPVPSAGGLGHDAAGQEEEM